MVDWSGQYYWAASNIWSELWIFWVSNSDNNIDMLGEAYNFI